MPTLIAHFHIFKNAGSSVDHILSRTFGDRWATMEGESPTSLLRPDQLRAFVKQYPDACAVSSHLLRPPPPTDLDVLPVILIRQPLDRAFSVYSHERRSRSDDLQSACVAQRTDFREFVRWCLDHKSLGGMVIANYQVIHLSPASFRHGHIYHATANEQDLLDAIDCLSDGACFGTVDRFGVAMTKLRQMAARAGLPMSEEDASENVTHGRPQDLDSRLSIAREQLGPGLYRRFRAANELDYRLYEWASLNS